MARAIFNESEIEFIKSNYSTMDTSEIAKILGFTRKQIKGKADTLKLRKGIEITTFTDDETEFLRDNYPMMETSKIGEIIGKTVKQINDKASNMGLKKENRLTYSIDDTFFEKIDSEEKAYWLGFLYADGAIVERFNSSRTRLKSLTLEVGLSKNDRDHLEKFKKAISFEGIIKDKQVTLNGQVISTIRLVVYNTKMCRDLIKLGCTPRKSLSLRFPTSDIVPDEFVRDFIRGYFDGDGCVFYKHENNSYIINLVGTDCFIKGLYTRVSDKIDINKTKITKKGEASQVAWGGYANFVNWGTYLYKDSKVHLDRKRDKVIEAINTKVYQDTSRIAYYHRNMMV